MFLKKIRFHGKRNGRNNRRAAGLLAPLLAGLLLCQTVVPVSAASGYTFTLTADDAVRVSVTQGEEITLTAMLSGGDNGDTFPMYAVQYNLWYDEAMFQLVPESVTLGKNRDSGITISTFKLSGEWEGWQEIAASAYSTRASGDTWKNPTELMTFRLKAVGTGVSTIFARRASVSTPDGMSTYAADSNDVTVTVEKSSPDRGKQDDGVPSEDDLSDGQTPSDSDPTGEEAGTDPVNPKTEEPEPPQRNPEESGDIKKPDDSENTSGITEDLWRRFRDIPADAWYIESVNYTLEKNLFQGTGENTFSPEASMTRAMLVTVLHRMEGSPEQTGKSPFDDVPDGQWYSEAVKWAARNGVVNGYGNGCFGPSDPITRQQIAAILYRYASKNGMDTTERAALDGYRDAEDTADWAADAMRWTVRAGIINGMGDGILAPSGTATRAQVATMLMRYDRLRG